MKFKKSKKDELGTSNEPFITNRQYGSINDLYSNRNNNSTINELIRRAEDDKKSKDFEDDKKPEIITKRSNQNSAKRKETTSNNDNKRSTISKKAEVFTKKDDKETTEKEVPEEELREDTVKKSKFKNIELFTNFQLCTIALIIFIFMLFFAENNNIMYKQALTNRLKANKIERDSLLKEIHKDSLTIERIKNDDKFLEKYVREHFYYRAEDEDVFIVEPEKIDTTTFTPSN